MSLPTVMAAPKGARLLRRGVPWCYRNEIHRWPQGLAAGQVALVVDPQGNPIGQAFTSARSPIALRLLTRALPEEEPVDEAFFARRLAAALERRASLRGRDAYRVVHGEADLLPGLFVDRYGDAVALQTLSEGMDARKDALAAALAGLVGARVVVCRDDASGRDFEGLARERRVLRGSGPTRATYHEGERRLELDLLEDAKTGGFLDQVDNHLRAGALGRGEALDAFSYHGGFALALAGSCTSVLAVEQDEAAAARARANAAANGCGHVTVQTANAFDVLHGFADQGRRFDTVVLDPPGLAKRKEGLEAARRAYHELNLRAFKLLRPDGLLVSCSCSAKMTRERFEEAVLAAAADAKRSVQILERRGAGVDHPVLGTLPETDYLKALFLRVL